MRIDFRFCGSSAQFAYTSQNIVSVRCRSSFYPFSKTIKINLQVSGTQTFGEFKSVFNNIFFNLTPEYMRIDFRSCGSSAQLVYTSQNIVSVWCRFSFYPFSKTIKINFQVSGNQTFGEFKSVFNNISLNLTHEYMRFDFRFCGSSAKLVYTSQNIAADKVDRIIIISLINCMNRNTQAHTRMD